jgi:hypothetical protein
MFGYEFVKEPKMKEEWVAVKGERKIPLEVFTSFIKALGITVIIYLAFNIGQYNNNELVKWFSYFHGIKNTDGTFTECYPAANGTTLNWFCDNSTRIQTQFGYGNQITNYTFQN